MKINKIGQSLQIKNKLCNKKFLFNRFGVGVGVGPNPNPQPHPHPHPLFFFFFFNFYKKFKNQNFS